MSDVDVVGGTRSAVASRRQATDTGRVLQLLLASIWVVDGLLQLQPFMFSRAFGNQMLAGTAAGNPSPIAHSITWADLVVGHHSVMADIAFALVQLVIGFAIAWRPLVKVALAGSIVWSCLVWWFGEGLGGLLSGSANPVTGAPGAVLLASIPPSGITGFLLRRFRRHFWLTAGNMAITKSLRSVGGTPELTRETFFSEWTPDVDVVRYAAQLDEEYVGKLVLDMLWLDLPRPNRVAAPLLVLGAEDDVCFTQKEVRATAAAYRTEAEIFPAMGHDMMLEPGWRAVAERIHAWLKERVADK